MVASKRLNCLTSGCISEITFFLLGHHSLILLSPFPRACAMTSRMAQTDAGAKLSYFRKINTFITTDGGLKLLDIFYMYI